MTRLPKILFTLGLLLLLFAYTIPFSGVLNEQLEDIIIYRVVIIAGLFISIASAVAHRKDFYLTNVNYAIIGGIISLLLVSTARLFKQFDTRLYFYIPVYTVIIGVIVITIARLWLVKLLHYFKY